MMLIMTANYGPRKCAQTSGAFSGPTTQGGRLHWVPHMVCFGTGRRGRRLFRLPRDLWPVSIVAGRGLFDVSLCQYVVQL